MEGAVVLFAVRAVGQAVAYAHIGLVGHERSQKLRCGLGGVRVVAVHHDVVVGVDVAQHLAHHVALALAAFGPHHGAVLGRDGSGAVGGVVVVDVHGRFGQHAPEVVDHLADGYGLVVAGDEHGDGAALGARRIDLLIHESLLGSV